MRYLMIIAALLFGCRETSAPAAHSPHEGSRAKASISLEDDQPEVLEPIEPERFELKDATGIDPAPPSVDCLDRYHHVEPKRQHSCSLGLCDEPLRAALIDGVLYQAEPTAYYVSTKDEGCQIPAAFQATGSTLSLEIHPALRRSSTGIRRSAWGGLVTELTSTPPAPFYSTLAWSIWAEPTGHKPDIEQLKEALGIADYLELLTHSSDDDNGVLNAHGIALAAYPASSERPSSIGLVAPRLLHDIYADEMMLPRLGWFGASRDDLDLSEEAYLAKHQDDFLDLKLLLAWDLETMAPKPCDPYYLLFDRGCIGLFAYEVFQAQETALKTEESICLDLFWRIDEFSKGLFVTSACVDQEGDFTDVQMAQISIPDSGLPSTKQLAYLDHDQGML